MGILGAKKWRKTFVSDNNLLVYYISTYYIFRIMRS